MKKAKISKINDPKKVELLKNQLRQNIYSKSLAAKETTISSIPNVSPSLGSTPTARSLKRDLLKIFILSIIAIGTQFALYFSLNASLVKLPY